jgi:serine/threonine protein kinase
VLKDRHLLSQLIPTAQSHIYEPVRLIARGEFGIVVEALSSQFRQHVAIKRYLEDPDIKTRELQVLRASSSKYILRLLDHFYAPGPAPRSRYVFVITDLYPMTLANYVAKTPQIPVIMRKLFAFQVFAGLAYLHSRSVMHRDIDLPNLLVDPDVGKLVVADFGCAKVWEPDTESMGYMFRRKYRAPELLLGETVYTPAVDVWAGACVYLEMLRGAPLFQAGSPAGMMQNIVAVLGPVTGRLAARVSPNMNLPAQPLTSLERELKAATREELDFLRQTLVIDPEKRPSAQDCVCHCCFDALFSGMAVLPNRAPIPLLDRGGYDHRLKLLFGD